MENPMLYALLAVFIVSLVSLIGIFALSLNTRILNQSIFLLVSLAVGALFGDALIHLIPEAYEGFDTAETASLFVLLGIFAFFALEKLLRWRHTHRANHVHEVDVENPAERERHRVRPLGFLVIASDGVHNFLDGVIIGASFLVSVEVGIATTLAIILHEIPQEIGDFGLLLHAGFKKARALFVNFLSALTAIAGTLLALFLGGALESFTPAATAFAAGSFIYIAGADLVPELHKTVTVRRSIMQLAAVLLGAILMWLLLFID